MKLDAVKGQRYTVVCQRPKTSYRQPYEGVYLGQDGEWSLFDLGGGVRLRVDEWALVGLEPA